MSPGLGPSRRGVKSLIRRLIISFTDLFIETLFPIPTLNTAVASFSAAKILASNASFTKVKSLVYSPSPRMM
jgi:hypothetical protein